MSNFMWQIHKQDEIFVIAEIGANHNGDMNLAKELILSAKDCGVDAVKFQSWSKTSLFSRQIYKQNENLSDERFRTKNLEEMVELLSLKAEQHRTLSGFCKEIGVLFSSSSFSPQEVDFLDELDVPFFKVPSMDVTHLPLIEYTARKKRPIILSTGMASLGEIDEAIKSILSCGNSDLILMHCVSLYPPQDGEVNLNNIDTFQSLWGLPVGFSDHTSGFSIPLAAIAKGACVIEKHFTLDKKMPGWDHAISADPGEMKLIVREGRRIVKALGSHRRCLSEREFQQRASFRRSIVAKRMIYSGELLEEAMLDFKRPGTAIAPNEIQNVLGRKAKRTIMQDELLSWQDIS